MRPIQSETLTVEPEADLVEPTWLFGDGDSPRGDSKNLTFAFEEDESPRPSTMGETAFERIYKAAFGRAFTQKYSDKTLALEIFNLLETLISEQISTPPIQLDRLRTSPSWDKFLLQVLKPEMDIERIALIFSLQDFLIRAVEHIGNLPANNSIFGYNRREHGWQGGSCFRGLIESLFKLNFPIELSSHTQDPNTFRIQILDPEPDDSEAFDSVGPKAYFTLGAMGAATEQALRQLAIKITGKDLFPAVPITLYSNALLEPFEDYLEETATQAPLQIFERFDPRTIYERVVMGFKNIPVGRLEIDSFKLRNEQAPLVGSLRLTKDLSPGPTLITNVLFMILQVKVIKRLASKELIGVRTVKELDKRGFVTEKKVPIYSEKEFAGINTLLLLTPNDLKIDQKVLSDIFSWKPSPKEWKEFYDLMRSLNPAELKNFLLALDSQSLDETLLNAEITDKPSSLYYSSAVDADHPAAFHHYTNLPFGSEHLFSKTQGDLLETNLMRMKEVAIQFEARPSPQTFLQLAIAFDLPSARRFVIDWLFQNEKKVVPLPGVIFDEEILQGYLLILDNSLTEDELRVLLYQPEKAATKKEQTSPTLLQGIFTPPREPKKSHDEPQPSNITPPPHHRD